MDFNSAFVVHLITFKSPDATVFRGFSLFIKGIPFASAGYLKKSF
jgi:hypothetical protein